jgi:hypothetical protein
VSLNSCTADEVTSTPEAKTDTSKTTIDGDPLLTNPR